MGNNKYADRGHTKDLNASKETCKNLKEQTVYKFPSTHVHMPNVTVYRNYIRTAQLRIQEDTTVASFTLLPLTSLDGLGENTKNLILHKDI